jgi:nucleotide-binding universal stress UspA family protein
MARAFHASLYLDAGCDGECGMRPEEVCGHAQALEADLLVIGRKYPHGRCEDRLGDADAIIREAPCAVLSV